MKNNSPSEKQERVFTASYEDPICHHSAGSTMSQALEDLEQHTHERETVMTKRKQHL